MSTDIKHVSGAVREGVEKLKKKAADAKSKLDKNLDDANAAIDLAANFADEIGAATRELRDVLGVKTNNPPAEEDKKKGMFS